MPTADIVVVHPGVQHSGDLASALELQGRLDRLVTRLQIGVQPGWPWRQLLQLSPAQRALARRTLATVPDRRVRRLQAARDVTELLVRRHVGPEPGRRLAQYNYDAFQRAVAARIPSGTCAVIGTDGASELLFAALRAQHPQILRVLDVAHPPEAVVQRMLRDDARQLGLPLVAYDDYDREPAPEAGRRERALADVVMVASSFTASCVAAEGVPDARLCVVPYAVDPVDPVAPETELAEDGTLRLVFVGSMSERKGMSCLLRAMEDLLGRGARVQLRLIGRPAGGYQLPTVLPANVTCVAAPADVDRRREVASAHLLVLPSMCEGYGRVLLEALAVGTGVLATDRSAAPDLQAEDPDAPVFVLPVAHRDQLADLLLRLSASGRGRGADRRRARALAAEHTVARYGEHVQRAVRQAQLLHGDARQPEMPA